MSLSDVRRDYEGRALDERDADADPFRQLSTWLDAARERETDPTAMALSTVDEEGQPSTRIVLLKEFDSRGLVFYTNYESQKGRDIAHHPRVGLLFYWATLNRQVRVDGSATRIDSEESDAYFASRPPESRLAALVSPQSRVIADRQVLDAIFTEALSRQPDGNVARPPFWGGYRVVPRAFEFWQGRPSRLHDRLRYERQANGSWTRVRLAP